MPQKYNHRKERKNTMQTRKIIGALVASLAIGALGYLPVGVAEEGNSLSPVVIGTTPMLCVQRGRFAHSEDVVVKGDFRMQPLTTLITPGARCLGFAMIGLSILLCSETSFADISEHSLLVLARANY